jgi:hypothetical protein
MPAQAFGLKEYRCGISPVSRISDKEQTVAPLRQSEVLRVQACPRAKIPEFIHRSQEKPDVSSLGGRQESGNILKDEPTGFKSSNNSQGDEGQVAARVIQAETLSCDAVGLAGASKDENIGICDASCFFREAIGGHIPEVDRMRVTRREYG